MQPLRTSLRNIRTLKPNRITKPTNTITARTFKTTSPVHNMSLFPRFTQEFAPLFRLMDDYDRRVARPDFDRFSRSFTPKFDVKEVEDAYELHGEFPGIEQKDINIEWTDSSTLTVSGRHETVREEGERPSTLLGGSEQKAQIEGAKHYEKPSVEDEGAAEQQQQVAKQTSGTSQEVEKKKDEGTKYWVSERSVGEFHRSFSFPQRVDQDAVKASLKNGILAIVVPKAKQAVPRRVQIE